MNRRNGILIANMLPKGHKPPQVVSKKEMRIPNKAIPVTEFMKAGESPKGYAAVYILTTSVREAIELRKKKFTQVEQELKASYEAAVEWLDYPDYSSEEDLRAFYIKSKQLSISGETYTYVGCCHVDEQHVHRYKGEKGSLLIFVQYGKVTEIKYY